ncbi:amidohydrolase [Glaciimonas sp. PCH181]|uniref:amidohydrolase family protein n=1 Tax=Glaciimonas sp. PCH181 TaxID=2133943 RepID=UPI0011B239ED|nr:amidohydrolase family protein [Glaciimonas sp. PCH181]
MSLAALNMEAVGSAAITDCHVHVFEDTKRYPLQVVSTYEPPLSPVGTLLEVAEAAGVARFVLVQPTAYGDDLSVLKMALLALNGRARGVGVAQASTTREELLRMRDAGVVALRFVGTKLPDGSAMPGTVSLDALCSGLGQRLRELGMHAELWAPLPEILTRWNQLESVGIPIVLDHMGGFDPGLGRDHKDFQRLLALLREGKVWVKLAICRRVSGSNFDPLRPFHDDMIAANRDRLLWASDFPFVRYQGPTPTTSGLLAQFHSWVPDKEVAHRILTQNPARLYQFTRH